MASVELEDSETPERTVNGLDREEDPRNASLLRALREERKTVRELKAQNARLRKAVHHLKRHRDALRRALADTGARECLYRIREMLQQETDRRHFERDERMTTEVLSEDVHEVIHDH